MDLIFHFRVSILFSLTVWEALESLEIFVYKTHRQLSKLNTYMMLTWAGASGDENLTVNN